MNVVFKGLSYRVNSVHLWWEYRL